MHPRTKINKTYQDINLQDRYGYSALHYACRNGHIHIVKKILSTYDVNVNLSTNGGATPLMRAAMAPSTDSLEILLNDKRILTDPIDEEGQNFLHKLCRKFSTSPANQNAEKIINHFPDLAKVKDKYGKMPFEYFDPNISKMNINN